MCRVELIKTTLSALRQDLDLWYKIQVLLYDFSKVARDPQPEKRISSMTHALYISEPYFSMSESTRILTAVIDDSEIVEAVAPPCPNTDDDTLVLPKGTTIEEVSMTDWPTSSTSAKLAVMQGRAGLMTWSQSTEVSSASRSKSCRTSVSWLV